MYECVHVRPHTPTYIYIFFFTLHVSIVKEIAVVRGDVNFRFDNAREEVAVLIFGRLSCAFSFSRSNELFARRCWYENISLTITWKSRHSTVFYTQE